MGQFQTYQWLNIVIHLGFLLCCSAIRQELLFLLWQQKKTGILNAINMHGKELHLMKTFNKLVAPWSVEGLELWG